MEDSVTNRAVPLIVCLLAALPFSALAATAYVTDELEITLRRGQGTQFGIRAMLDSGSRVEVLQQDAESGYTQVRTSSGTEGWVLSRYLQNNPVARERVDTARQAQSQAEQQAAEAVAQLETVQSENTQMRTQIGQLEEKVGSLETELRRVSSAAARPMEIQRRNEQLVEEVRTLEQERDRLGMELRNEQSLRDNWITGAAIAFIGLALGLVAPHLRRRKSGWEGLG